MSMTDGKHDHFTDLCDEADRRKLWVGVCSIAPVSDPLTGKVTTPGELTSIEIVTPRTADTKPALIHKVTIEDGDINAAALTVRQLLGVQA